MHTLLKDPNETSLSSKKRYFIASDLHLEFSQGKEMEFWKRFPYHDERVAIAAGDITSFRLPIDIVYKHFSRLCERFDKVVYVPGNHEYYGSDVTTVYDRLLLLEREISKLKVLRVGELYVYEGQRFIGDTMWFPDRPEVHIYKRTVNDSAQIKGLFPWAFTQSNLFMVFLRENVRPDDIVVTHHIPNDNNTNRIWKSSPTQSYFLNSTCDKYCNNPNSILPKAWIYGHTHDKHDFHIRDTRFICNPVGYPGENGQLPDSAEPSIYEI